MENKQMNVEKKKFSVKLIEKQQLEGMRMICSDMNCGHYEIREGTFYYYDSAVSMMNILEQ